MKPEDRDSFVFRRDWWLAIKDLPKEVRGEVCEGIVRYAFGEAETGLKNMAAMALRFVKPQIDRDYERYCEMVERNRDNGSKGGAPIGNQNARKQPKTTENNPKQPKTTLYDNDNDYDNNNSLSLSLSLSEENIEREDKGGVTAAERERFYEIFYFRNIKNPANEVDRFVDYYEANGWCRSTGQKPVKNRISLARAWKASSDQPRVDLTALKWLEAVYAHLKAEDKEAASAIIHGGVFNLEVEPIDVMHRRIVIYCASSKVYESIESAAAVAGVKAPGGYAVTYRVRKNS